jgi:hypothetical protein
MTRGRSVEWVRRRLQRAAVRACKAMLAGGVSDGRGVSPVRRTRAVQGLGTFPASTPAAADHAGAGIRTAEDVTASRSRTGFARNVGMEARMAARIHAQEHSLVDERRARVSLRKPRPTSSRARPRRLRPLPLHALGCLGESSSTASAHASSVYDDDRAVIRSYHEPGVGTKAAQPVGPRPTRATSWDIPHSSSTCLHLPKVVDLLDRPAQERTRRSRSESAAALSSSFPPSSVNQTTSADGQSVSSTNALPVRGHERSHGPSRWTWRLYEGAGRRGAGWLKVQALAHVVDLVVAAPRVGARTAAEQQPPIETSISARANPACGGWSSCSERRFKGMTDEHQRRGLTEVTCSASRSPAPMDTSI